MFNLRKKIFIITGILFGFLISILLVIYLRGDKDYFETPEGGIEEQADSPDEDSGVVIPANKVITGPRAVTQTPDEIYLKQLTGIFVERFNSYSNLADNSHIDDAIALATGKMAIWLNSQRIEKSVQYEGITTKVLASDIKSMSDTKAVVSFGASQMKRSAEGDADSVFRSGFVNLLKVNNEWKVDGFYWEE